VALGEFALEAVPLQMDRHSLETVVDQTHACMSKHYEGQVDLQYRRDPLETVMESAHAHVVLVQASFDNVTR
jgi:uncharacterized protein YqgV (UPF0045/DUF77 family)